MYIMKLPLEMGGKYMYCKHCGRIVDDNSNFCNNCGMRFDNRQNFNDIDDSSSVGFAILGFFIPLVGLILFLVYESKRPKRAKSAGIGALIGFITKIVISIVCEILCVVFAYSIFGNIASDINANDIKQNIPAISEILHKESTEDILEKYVDVSFGEFKVTDNGYYPETSLEVTVKNKAEKQFTYYITIEAVDADGARIETDMIYADRLNSGQEIHLTAFEYVEQEKIEQLKNADFKVLEINKYDY